MSIGSEAPAEALSSEGTPSPERPMFMVVDPQALAHYLTEELRGPKPPGIKTLPEDTIASINANIAETWPKSADDVDEPPSPETGFATSAEYTENAATNLEDWEAAGPHTPASPEAVHAVRTSERTIAFRGVRGWFRSAVEARHERGEHRRRFYRTLGSAALDFAYSPLRDGSVKHMEYEKPRTGWERLYDRVITRSAQSARTYNEQAVAVGNARQVIDERNAARGHKYNVYMSPKRRRQEKRNHRQLWRQGHITRQEYNHEQAETGHKHFYREIGDVPKSPHEKQTANRQKRRNWVLNKLVGTMNKKEQVKEGVRQVKGIPLQEAKAFVHRQVEYTRNDWADAKKAARIAREEGAAALRRQAEYARNDLEDAKKVARGVVRGSRKVYRKAAKFNQEHGDRGGSIPLKK